MKLNDIPKHNIYKVPDGYFDRLPARVMEQTAASGTSAVPWFSLIRKPVRLALAPLVLLLIFVSVFVLNEKVKQETEPAYVSVSSIPDAEILAYLNSYASLETSDFEELSLSEKDLLAAEFMNVSSEAAEEELEYYQLNHLIY